MESNSTLILWCIPVLVSGVNCLAGPPGSFTGNRCLLNPSLQIGFEGRKFQRTEREMEERERERESSETGSEEEYLLWQASRLSKCPYQTGLRISQCSQLCVAFLRWHESRFKSDLAHMGWGCHPNHNRYRIMNMLIAPVLLVDMLMH